MKRTDIQQDNNIRELILRLRKLMLTSQLLRGFVIWLVVTLGLWLVLFAVDNLLHLPEGLRLALSVGGLVLMAFELWQLLLLPIVRRQQLESVTLFLENRFSIPENMLINALCFESTPRSPREEPFAAETIRTGSEMMSKADVVQSGCQRIVAIQEVEPMVDGALDSHHYLEYLRNQSRPSGRQRTFAIHKAVGRCSARQFHSS
ncbi:MAG: hypothetical protein ACYS7Y_35485 [Planctomycetota bacterium]|jgi:hypothetical protein